MHKSKQKSIIYSLNTRIEPTHYTKLMLTSENVSSGRNAAKEIAKDRKRGT